MQGKLPIRWMKRGFQESARACLVLMLALAAASVRGQSNPNLESYLRLHYTKREFLVPMRDGVRLFTAVYTPRDTTRTYPILLRRTPYSVAPYGEDKYPASLGPSEAFVRSGYIFVNQDVRGRYMSEGTFVEMTPHRPVKSGPRDIDESTDTYDTIDWLLKNVPEHNGRVGMYGISYPGFYCSAGMIDAHPALKAVSPQAPVADWYFDDFLHNGAFFLAHAFRWLGSNDLVRPKPTTERPPPLVYPTPDGYELFLRAGNMEDITRKLLKDSAPFWREMMEHPQRDDFWKQRNILPHLKNVAPAVMVVGGWFDAEDLYGIFQTYRAIERQNPHVQNVLVVGPWHHGGWASTDGERLGPVSFGAKTAVFYRTEIEFPFFERHLKDQPHPPLPEATVFETGSNIWRTFDAWPPRQVQTRPIYLREQGGLAWEPPPAGEHFDEYLSDPARPVPYTPAITPQMTIEYMVEDQRFAARRPDVLVYQLPPQEEDLILAGPVEVELWVTTTGSDADFIVKLIDVFPDHSDPARQPGFQMHVRSEVFRARYRNSFEHPEPLVPGQPARLRFTLQDVLHRFQQGHRLMVHIQSTWFPLVDRNPQTFVPNIYLARPEDYQKATHRVLRSAQYPSRLTVGVLPVAALPH